MKLNLKTKAYLKRTRFYNIYKRKKNKSEKTFDKDHTWIFNAGATFAGNPKWLFIYICKYRKDIDAHWFCDNEDTVSFVRSLGYSAYTFTERDGLTVQKNAGVYVVEQVKEVITPYMKEAKYLNLFHGVGLKVIERKLTEGFLSEQVSKKYIQNNQFFRNNQLFLVTSPFMEDHFKEHCGIDDDKVIRAGYPRCIYQKYYDPIQTFDHDILSSKGLPADTRIAAYVPTYSDEAKNGTFFRKALPDMEALIARLEETKTLLIIKMHPMVANAMEYLQIKEYYGNSPWLYFWDNKDDFYEILDRIDIGIIDYSSIYYDMLEGGTKSFLRYFYTESDRDLIDDVYNMTSGFICRTFAELLDAFGHPELLNRDENEERIRDLFWSYSDKDSMEKIVNETLSFEPDYDREFPSLHSFDIFDTLISRKVMDPTGIFYYVMDAINASSISFPKDFYVRYPSIRENAEENIRDKYRKNVHRREDHRREITFPEIFEKIREIYKLNDEQIQFLMDCELEAELDNCIACPDKIYQLKECLREGNDVILISDMYHDRDFIERLLNKADPELNNLPLFLSSEIGVQKTTKLLYIEIYNRIENYIYKEWIHHGDNTYADGRMPSQLGIIPDVHIIPKLNDYERNMVEYINTYDGCLLAAAFARFRYNNQNSKDYFSYAYISAYFFPYVSWVLRDAMERGYKTLYFISRDGYHLKRIADVIIDKKGYDLKTKYIYGSRRAWRIPSFIDHVDEDFYGGYGSLADINSYSGIIKALNLTDEDFRQMFPEYAYLSKGEAIIDKPLVRLLAETAKYSEKYNEHLLKIAKDNRQIIIDYFNQEMDFDEPYAFVEYWGRGYTQECHKRLIDATIGSERDLPYYYARSINGTEGGNIRYNYTENMYSMTYVESLFANIPYKSIEEYEWKDGKVCPVIEKIPCDLLLFESMERNLIKFVEEISAIEFNDSQHVFDDYFHFGMEYFKDNPDDILIAENLGPLIDAVGTYSEKKEFAPKFTSEMLDAIKDGEKFSKFTRSKEMSAIRSDPDIRLKYLYVTEVFPEEKKKLDREERLQQNLDIQAEKALGNINSKLSDRIAQNDRYKKFRKEEIVKGKVLVFQKEDKQDYGRVYSFLKNLRGSGPIPEEGDDHLVYYTDKSKITKEMLFDIATAEFILLSYNAGIISNLTLRPETKVVQLWYDAFQYNNSGLTRSAALARQEIMKKEEILRDYRIDVFPAGSRESAERIRRCIHRRNAGAVKAIGSPVTDIYFDEAYKEARRKQLYELFPEADGKKVILFMPLCRKRANKAFILTLFNVERLKEALGDQYVFIIHCTRTSIQESYTIPAHLQDFARELTDDMNLRDIMCCSDIIIGDYTNEYFESVLLDIPVSASCEDQEDYENTKDVSLPYEEVKIGKALYDTRDLIDAVRHIDEYDPAAKDRFRQTYFSECDGKSGKRLLDMLKK